MWKDKRVKFLSTFLFCLTLTTLQACHTMKFQIENVQHETVVQDTNWFFVSGLFPTRDIDVASKCPAGASAIKEQTTGGNVAITILTLSIATPRTSWYYCMPANIADRKPLEPTMKEESK